MFGLGKQYRSSKAPNGSVNCYKSTKVTASSKIESTRPIRGKGLGSAPKYNMIYYSLDPQFATLLCSVYSRNERLGFSLFPDVFSFSGDVPSSSSILSYAHAVGLQLIAVGEHYARLLGQVRTGSVIFLVGVGSLVCWKLWEYWNNGGDVDPSNRRNLSPSSKSPRERTFLKGKRERTKEFLASFLEEEFVNDIADLEDEDPDLIQGRYFGPDSPVEAHHSLNTSPLTNSSSAKSRSESARDYLADNSASYSIDDDVGFQTSDFEHDSLPYDNIGSVSAPQSPICVARNRLRRTKRRFRQAEELIRSLSSSPAKSPIRIVRSGSVESQIDPRILLLKSKRLRPCGRSFSVCEDDFSSPETSPRLPPRTEKSSNLSQKTPFKNVGRGKQGDGSETQDLEETLMQRTPRGQRFANYNSDEEWSTDERAQPDGEKEMDRRPCGRQLSREISLGDLMERLRQRSNQRKASLSLSRDNSVSSRLSDFLRRDDSICSNLSEYAASECSELSLELSYRDDIIANHTITSLADIEDELNTLKSSVYEIDEEFVRFASRPNPYLFKTTFSDYSFDSDSRPESATGVFSYRLTRTSARLNSDRERSVEDDSLVVFLDNEPIPSFEPTPDREIKGSLKRLADEEVNFDLSSSVESNSCDVVNKNNLDELVNDIRKRCVKDRECVDSNAVIVQSSRPPLISTKPFKRHRSRLFSYGSLPRTTTQEEALLSLEWDNEGLKQYEDESAEEEECDAASSSIPEIQNMEGFEEHKAEFRRSTFLPDHSSLELDLEEELEATSSDSQSMFRGREAIATALGRTFRNSRLSDDQASLAELTNKLEQVENCFQSPISLPSQPCDDSFKKPLPPSYLPLQEKTSDSTYNPMSTSVDSAIQSASGSRSGSCSPLPQSLTQSMNSSGIASSWSEASSELTSDLENTVINSFGGCDRPKDGVAEYRRKLRKFWSSEESGFAEGESLDSSATNLSPVHELREKESLDPIHSDSDESNNVYNNNFRDHSHNPEADFISQINDNDKEGLNINIMGNNSSRTLDPNGRSSNTDYSLLRHGRIKAVGEKIDIITYAENEWKGNTVKAQNVRNGYAAIPKNLELIHLRQIRGDNYCGLRAVVFQLLTSGLPVPSGYQVYNRLLSEINKGSTWLKEYSFGRRLHYTKDQVVKGIKECLDALDNVSLDLIGCENKESLLISKLNGNDLLDTMLCEAAKLHMLVCALDLHRDEMLGGHVPLFGMIMFARQTCSDPKEFLFNHLNAVGDSAGLEQIEMFLLGYALRVTIQVVRPSSFGNEDFICFYPDENIGDWPEVTLVAEDDRHYNVLVK